MQTPYADKEVGSPDTDEEEDRPDEEEDRPDEEEDRPDEEKDGQEFATTTGSQYSDDFEDFDEEECGREACFIDFLM